MLGKSHFVMGVALGSLISWPAAVSAGIASLLPDIDTHESTVGRLVSPVSWAIEKTVGHRNLFHSIWAAMAVYLSCQFLPYDVSLGVLIGYLSHILLDAFNPAGVRIFWPVPFNLSIPLVQAGSLLEYLLVMPVAVLLLLKNIF